MSIDGALACLDTFCLALGVIASTHKTDFWLTGLDTPQARSLLLGLILRIGHCMVFRDSLWSWVIAGHHVRFVL